MQVAQLCEVMNNPFIDFREANNLTLAGAAERCGVNKSTYLRWESGQTKVSIERLPKIERVLGVSRKTLRPDFFEASAA